jgi:hypothetical protein
MSMANDISSYPITGVVTPSDPDRRGQDGYSPRRQKPQHPPASRPVHTPAVDLPDDTTIEPLAPPHIGTRIDVRV